LIVRDIEEIGMQNSTTTLFGATPSYLGWPCSVSYKTVVVVNKYESIFAVGRHDYRITHSAFMNERKKVANETRPRYQLAPVTAAFLIESYLISFF
jgi:hypothetical protein